MMNLKSNFIISSKSIFKWTWRKRCYSISQSSNVLKIDENLRSFRALKYPESMFVYNEDVASKYQHTI